MALGRKARNMVDTAISRQPPEPFSISTGNLRGGPFRPYLGGAPSTHLSEWWDKDFRADRPTYVVWSYWTPIAWVTSDGKWRVPTTKHSRTTTNHQNVVRAVILMRKLPTS